MHPLYADSKLPGVGTHTTIRLENILDKNIYCGAKMKGAAL